ncbi:MAG: hypothetical protein KJ621_06150 [Proteobacteria bacterium]|nr:hypothetical protein [Pseudomonadota bacterium]
MSVQLDPAFDRLFDLPANFTYNGWDRVTWNMTPEQVKLHYPQAQEMGRTLRLEGQVTYGRPYYLDFGFDQHRRLTSVKLAWRGQGTAADYAHLARRLQNKFGRADQTTPTSMTWTNQGKSSIAAFKPTPTSIIFTRV